MIDLISHVVCWFFTGHDLQYLNSCKVEINEEQNTIYTYKCKKCGKIENSNPITDYEPL